MRARLVTIVLAVAGGTACAEPENQDIRTLESCLQSARETDPVCSNPANDPARSLECFQRARTALLQCMERAAQGASPGDPVPEGSAAPDTATSSVSPENPAAAVPPEKPDSAQPSDKVTGTGTAAAAKPTIVGDAPAKQVDTGWVVSETTSPVDFTPLITATMRSKSGAAALIIRCRGLRTELSLRAERAWRSSGSGEIEMAYQINNQLPVPQAWTQSSDGKTANYKADAVALLQSLPEGAQLKISQFNAPGAGLDASFQLTGWDAIQRKLAAICKWPPQNRLSSGKP